MLARPAFSKTKYWFVEKPKLLGKISSSTIVTSELVVRMVAPPVGCESVSKNASSGSAMKSFKIEMATLMFVTPSLKVMTRLVGV